MKKRREVNAAAFVSQAAEKGPEKAPAGEDLHRYVHRTAWPVEKDQTMPSLAEGSTLHRSMTIPLQEREWLSVDRHTRALGISKARWVRHAIFKLMREEQDFCSRHRPSETDSSPV